MKLTRNPTQDTIYALIKASPFQAAKWLQCRETGDLYCWSADPDHTHAKIAQLLYLECYDKGIFVTH